MLRSLNLKNIFRKGNFDQLTIITDGASWVLDYEANELKKICSDLGIKSNITNVVDHNYSNQCLYYTSKYVLSNESVFGKSNRIATDYYHGLPSSDPKFKEVYDSIMKHQDEVARIRVSYSIIEKLFIDGGFDRSKIFRIPIGVDTDAFTFAIQEEKLNIRKELGIPENAVVIGSFQKDGNGWEDGNEPKLIKGPDIFLKTIEILKNKIPNLFILLSGPTRGYVKNGLTEMKVPFVHKYVDNYIAEIPKFYKAIDLYIISSREEGGPKAVLESMASGIPLVTTAVGQGIDLVKHGVNGWIVPVEDFEGLAHFSMEALNSDLTSILQNGRKTALENNYPSLIPLWKNFFTGYVNF